MNKDLLSKNLDNLSDPWMGGHTNVTNSRITMCRIYAVDSNNRTCSIKTYGSDQVVSNADYTDVQWLSMYSSPDGDEVTVIPRVGSTGICAFVDGMPWLLGFFQPVTVDDETEIPDPEFEGADSSGSSAAVNKEKINEGDFIQRAIAGNRLVLRAGGEVEIESTKICRRVYFPIDNRINEISQNFEQRTDGGTIDWVHIDKDSDYTKFTQVWRTDINQTHLIIDERGTVEEDSSIIQRYSLGSFADFEDVSPTRPRIIEQIYDDGSREYFLRQPDGTQKSEAYYYRIGTDGEFERGINDFGYYESIKPTGELKVNINNKWNYTVLATGETTLDIGIAEKKKALMPGEGGKGKFQLNIKPTGDVTLNVADKNMISILASGQVKIDIGPGKTTMIIGADGSIKVNASSKMEVTAPLVDLKGKEVKLGSGVSDVVPMGKLLLAAVNKFIAIFNSHNHVGNLGAPTSPPQKPAQEITADVLSATVKVQP